MHKKYKMKLLCVSLVVIQVCSLFWNPAFARADLHWAADTIASLEKSGIVNEGEFSESDYDSPISRGKFVLVFVRLFRGWRKNGNHTAASFVDVSVENPYYEAVTFANQEGLVEGYPDGSFRPEATIERQELFTIIGRMLKSQGADAAMSASYQTDEVLAYADAEEIAAYARDSVWLLTGLGIVKGYDDNTVKPNECVTNAEALAITARVDALVNADGAPKQPSESVTVKPSPTADPRPQPSFLPTATPTANPTASPTAPKTSPTASPTVNESTGSGSNGSDAVVPSLTPSPTIEPNPTPSPTIEPNLTPSPTITPRPPLMIADHVVALNDIKTFSLRVYYHPDTMPNITLDGQDDDISLITEYLQGLRLRAPVYPTDLIGSSYQMLITYYDGTTVEIEHTGNSYIAFHQNACYPIMWYKEAVEFDQVIGQVLINQYKKKGLTQLSGIVTEASKVYGAPYSITLTDIEGKQTTMTVPPGRVFFMIDSMRSEMVGKTATAFFQSADSDVAEAFLITGPQRDWETTYNRKHDIIMDLLFEQWMECSEYNTTNLDKLFENTFGMYPSEWLRLFRLSREDIAAAQADGGRFIFDQMQAATDCIAIRRKNDNDDYVMYLAGSKDAGVSWSVSVAPETIPQTDLKTLSGNLLLARSLVDEFPWVESFWDTENSPDEIRYFSVDGFDLYVCAVRAANGNEYGMPFGSDLDRIGLQSQKLYPMEAIIAALN